MKTSARLGLYEMLLAIALIVASCGGDAASSDEDRGGMKGMDHDKSGGGMAGMDHEVMGSGSMSDMPPRMVMRSGKYSDAAFVDAMILHHEGAVEMAEVAVKRAEHEKIEQLAHNIISSQKAEIKDIAKDIVSAQKREIEEMKQWRREWYPEG
jgi:uncharacterized protein (DUF305 family)